MQACPAEGSPARSDDHRRGGWQRASEWQSPVAELLKSPRWAAVAPMLIGHSAQNPQPPDSLGDDIDKVRRTIMDNLSNTPWLVSECMHKPLTIKTV